MPGGAAEDVPVCLVLGTASVTAIEKKTKIPHFTVEDRRSLGEEMKLNESERQKLGTR